MSNPFKFDLFNNFHDCKASDSFNLKLKQWICKKRPKVVLLDNCFPNLFTEVQILYLNHFKFGLGCSERQSKF